jgi:GR25 family glycosyltransferase involved in LPS biosynthesis
MDHDFRGSKLVTLLQLLGFPVVVCKATLLSDETFDNYLEDQLKFFGRKLSNQEIGCKDSHYQILKFISLRKIPISLVLEDDAILTQNFQVKLKKIITDKKLMNNANIITLFYSHLVVKRASYLTHKLNYASAPHGNSSLLKCATPPYGTVGYLVTNKAAEIATKARLGYSSTADWPYEWCGEVKFYTTNPPLVLHPKMTLSTIEEERSQILDSLKIEEKIKRNVTAEFIFGVRTLLRLVLAARELKFRKPIKAAVYKLIEIVSHRYPKLLSPFCKILDFPFYNLSEGFE